MATEARREVRKDQEIGTVNKDHKLNCQNLSPVLMMLTTTSEWYVETDQENN